MVYAVARRTHRTLIPLLVLALAFGVFMPPSAAAADPIVEITAKGFGHGLGLSQHGAAAMATAGYGYSSILRKYYTGVAVATDKVVARTVDVAVSPGNRASWTILGAEGTFTFVYPGGQRTVPAGSYTITASYPVQTATVRNTATGATFKLPINTSNGITVSGARSCTRDGVDLGAVALKETDGFRSFWGIPAGQYPAFEGRLVFRPVVSSGQTLLKCFNRLPMDDYVEGVEPFELGPWFPVEARKAQAVAARTYVVNRSFGSDQSSTFTRTPIGYTDAFQVYKGFGLYYSDTKSLYQWRDRKGAEVGQTGKVEAIVSSVSGRVVTYGNLAIEALFSSSHGGKSEHSENVYFTALPYLRGITESHPGKTFAKTRQFTGAEILEAVRATWGQVRAVPPTGTEITKFEITKVGYSRPIEIRITHPRYGSGSTTINDQQRMRAFARNLDSGFLSSYLTVKQLTSVPTDPIPPVSTALVQRVAGATPYETSARISRVAFSTAGSAPVAIVAARSIDALAASGLAGVMNGGMGGPILITGSTSLDPAVATELQRLGAKTVYIAGGTSVVSPEVEAALGALPGVTTKRIFGATAFDTARMLNREMKRLGDPLGYAMNRAIVVDVKGLDSVPAGALSYRQHFPIVPVDRTRVPWASNQTLIDMGITSTIVVGGEVVVPPVVFDRLPAPKRIAGVTMYDTSVALARLMIDWHGFSPSRLFFAAGTGDFEKMTDGIAAGPLAGRYRNPIILTQSPVPHATTAEVIRYYRSGINKSWILGNTDAVSLENERVIGAEMLK